MLLGALQATIHAHSITKGFWDERLSVIEKMSKSGMFNEVEIDFIDRAIRDQLLMLVVTEISEAVAAYRSNKHANLLAFHCSNKNNSYAFNEAFEKHIKDTHEDEIADTIIRLLGYAKQYNIDLEQHIQLKLHYNTTRPYKHGKNS